MDMQSLQSLRRKILKTSTVLSSCLDIASNLKDHCQELDKLELITNSKELEMLIDAYTATIKLHCRSVEEIMESLRGTFNLVYTRFLFTSVTC